jgi:hypothetical protein
LEYLIVGVENLKYRINEYNVKAAENIISIIDKISENDDLYRLCPKIYN